MADPFHDVKQGEHFAAIAAKRGHRDFRPPWDAGDNETIRNKRQTPHILLPRDVVFVPELATKEEDAPTTKKTRFKATGVQLKLMLHFLTPSLQPAANLTCDLTVESEAKAEPLDGKGTIERIIPLTSAAGRFAIRDPKLNFAAQLEIGGLHPLDTVTGQIGRLNNLGYDAGEIIEPASTDAKAQFRSAIEEFQCDNGLKVDGDLGDKTKAKLKEVYGC